MARLNLIRPLLRKPMYTCSSSSRTLPFLIGDHQLQQPIFNITLKKHSLFQFQRSYIFDMRKSAFEGNILRLLRNEIQYELQRSTPTQVFFFFGGKANKSKKLLMGFVWFLRKWKFIIVLIIIFELELGFILSSGAPFHFD